MPPRSRSRSRGRAASKGRTRTAMSRAKSVVAVVNLKSGGRRCALYVQQKLIRELGAAKVHTLFTGAPSQHAKDVEQFFLHHTPDVVIVAGGDGTISFVMDVVKSMQERAVLQSQKAVIAPFPLGTGNDLCVSLGFGSGFARWMVMGGIRFRKTLRRYTHAVAIPVNRWRLSFEETTGSPRRRGPPRAPRTHVMNNYLSIGFDAAIAERLNSFRGRHPYLFFTRPVIKLWYAVFAFMALFTEYPLRADDIVITIDGVEQTPPKGIKAVVVSNMLTYAGGSPLWQDDPARDITTPSVSDRVAEVTTLNGVWHLALVRLGLTYATKIGQGKHVQILIRTPCRMQYDGEPIDNLFDGAQGASRQYALDVSYYADSEVLEARQGAVKPTFFSVYWPLLLTAAVAVVAVLWLYHRFACWT